MILLRLRYCEFERGGLRSRGWPACCLQASYGCDCVVIAPWLALMAEAIAIHHHNVVIYRAASGAIHHPEARLGPRPSRPPDSLPSSSPHPNNLNLVSSPTSPTSPIARSHLGSLPPKSLSSLPDLTTLSTRATTMTRKAPSSTFMASPWGMP